MATYEQYYGGYIWTNHALQRLKQRHITQSQAYTVIRNPHTSMPGSSKGSTKYRKKINGQYLEIVTKKNEKGELLVISCWAKSTNRIKPQIPLWEKAIRFIGKFLIPQ